MTARDNFFSRLADIELALSDNSVQDGTLVDVARNAKARVLRNGLAVVLFAVLEDFIRNRTAEILGGIGAIGVPFTMLPAKLKKAATTGALNNLGMRVKLFEEADKLPFILQHAAKIASSGTTPYEISGISLVNSRSNIDKEEIKDALSAFSVEGGWSAMTGLAVRMNFGGLPLEDAFTSIALRRHAAAHEAGANTPLQELVGCITQMRAIASAYDCLVSRAYWQLRSRDPAYLRGDRFKHDTCAVSRVEKVGTRWRLLVPGRRNALIASDDEIRVNNEAHRNALVSGAFLLWVDSSSRPIRWACPGAV